MGDIRLKGRIIGFEEYENYLLQDAFGESSPFRFLSCTDAPVSFVVVNPFFIVEDYTFEIEDAAMRSLNLSERSPGSIAVMCIVRPGEQALAVNLRSPLVINTESGVFAQTVLQNETYGVSVPFTAKRAGE